MVRKEENPRAVSHDASRVCNVCSLEPECISWDLEQADYEKLDSIARHPPVVVEGNHLFRVGDNLTAVYAVRTGSFKTYAFNSDGHEHVLGFVFSGELIGFDGVYSRRHGCNAIAVEESAVCALPYYDLSYLMGRSTTLREQILRLASQGFGDRFVDSHLSPEARLANFLLDISRRTGNGEASGPLGLPVSTYDIGSYLRIAPQEIDSLLAYLMRQGIIYLNDRRLTLLNPDRLSQLASQKWPTKA